MVNLGRSQVVTDSSILRLSSGKNVYFTETEISLWEMKVGESHAYCHFHKLKRPAKGALEVDPAAMINRIYCSGNHPLLYNTKSITL